MCLKKARQERNKYVKLSAGRFVNRTGIKIGKKNLDVVRFLDFFGLS